MVFTGNPVPELDADWIVSGENNLNDGRHLVYFWSSGCPDCIERAKKLEEIDRRKLNVVGIHSPEYRFEKDKKNVRKVMEKHEISHPVAHDKDRGLWEKFQNFNGPKVVIVEDGRVKAQSSANSGQEELEKALKDIGFDIDACVKGRRHHPLGLNSRISGNKVSKGEVKQFNSDVHRRKNRIHLVGKWRQEEEFVESVENSGLFYQGCEELCITAEPRGIRDVEVRLGGEPVPEEKAGDDLRVTGERSYVRLKNPGVHELVKDVEAEIELRLEEKTRIYRISTG